MREHAVVGELETFMRETGRGGQLPADVRVAAQPGGAPADRSRAGTWATCCWARSLRRWRASSSRSAARRCSARRRRCSARSSRLLDAGLRAGMRAATPGTPVTAVVAAINHRWPTRATARTRSRRSCARGGTHGDGLDGAAGDRAAQRPHPAAQRGIRDAPEPVHPETGYMMCGEPVIVADDGAEPLTSKMGQLDSIG